MQNVFSYFFYLPEMFWNFLICYVLGIIDISFAVQAAAAAGASYHAERRAAAANAAERRLRAAEHQATTIKPW